MSLKMWNFVVKRGFLFVVVIGWIGFGFGISPSVGVAQQDELVEMTEEGSTQVTDPIQAQKSVLKEVVQKISWQMVEGIMGRDRAEAAKVSIQNKIIPAYERYIPIIKKSEPIMKGDETHITFHLKVSPTSLRALLVNEGILQISDNPLTILPLIRVQDNISGKSFAWWLQGISKIDVKDSSYALARVVQGRLQESFLKSGLFVLNPLSGQYGSWTPDALKRENLSLEDLQLMARSFKAPVVLSGTLQIQRLNPSAEGSGQPAGASSTTVRISLHMNALQVKQGRTVAESSESVDGTVDAQGQLAGDSLKKLMDQVLSQLSGQLIEIWNRGGLSVETLYLSLQGELSPADLDHFKNQIQKSARSVRAVRDRKFTSGAVVLEVDSAVAVSDLSRELSREKLLDGFNFQVTDTSSDTIRARVSVKR